MPMQEEDRNYVRRVNSDGTFDTICLKCFQTVACEMTEDCLERFEQVHVCVAEDRDRFDQWRSKWSAWSQFRPQEIPRILGFRQHDQRRAG
jgi:hypothetical protein